MFSPRAGNRFLLGLVPLPAARYLARVISMKEARRRAPDDARVLALITADKRGSIRCIAENTVDLALAAYWCASVLESEDHAPPHLKAAAAAFRAAVNEGSGHKPNVRIVAPGRGDT